MDHSYEHIRKTTIDSITQTRGGTFEGLRNAVAGALQEGEGNASRPGALIHFSSRPELSYNESRLFVEAFWDLFREGIITLGTDADNPNLPWFRASRLFDEKIQKEG